MTARSVRRWLAIVALAAIGCGNGFTTGEPTLPSRGMPRKPSGGAIRTSVCALVDAPQAFDGRQVELYGCISTDGQEHSSLTDPKTRCSGGGLLPVELPTLPESQKPAADADTIVCGTFKGTFRASNALYERVLEIGNTSNLTRHRR
jgi:hypothetical protein